VIDLDGVVWLAEEPIPGGARAIERLRSEGRGVVFATNNSAPSHRELVSRLAEAGIEADNNEIVTSADAAISLLTPGSTVVLCGGPGLEEALLEQDFTIVPEGPADAVVVGWSDQFNFATITAAALAIRGGARFIGTNEDPTHPTPRGLLPGTGALLAAVATAAEVLPEVAGKPHEPMATLLQDRYGDPCLMVGDRPATDGRFARRLGVPFALVLSGVTATDGRDPSIRVDVEAPDLVTLVERLFDRDSDGIS
jgi:4-nitrophenyl phosphatase